MSLHRAKRRVSCATAAAAHLNQTLFVILSTFQHLSVSANEDNAETTASMVTSRAVKCAQPVKCVQEPQKVHGAVSNSVRDKGLVQVLALISARGQLGVGV